VHAEKLDLGMGNVLVMSWHVLPT